jgi:hypothetical protein
MRSPCVVSTLIILLVLSAGDSAGQTSFGFDVTAYESFLASHKDISPNELLSMHPAGTFAASIPALSMQPLRLDSIDRWYSLTDAEKVLLGANGFVVTERISPWSFGAAFADIWIRDLPVYISTDAILHALHMSYDAILAQTEERFLIPKISTILAEMHGKLPELVQEYQSIPGMLPSLKDLDLYLTVARTLLDGQCICYFAANAGGVDTILQCIKNKQPGSCMPLFGDNDRVIDYSQFTVRGHYTQSQALSRYFQAMIWMGRTEFYLSPPDNRWDSYSVHLIQRQVVTALLFAESAALAGAETGFKEIDAILGYFVGEPDNVTLAQLNGLYAEVGLQSSAEVLDSLTYESFHSALMTHSWAYQRILSQILQGHTFEPGQVRPASAFLPLGQRFIIDSFVSSKVVFDNIEYGGEKVWRALPSALDIMFTLGNDAAGQLLVPQLERYHYAENLAALRYLIDAYEPDYWKETFFNGWLYAIRALNPPLERSVLPSHMQTAAWWQEKLNTQLASWAQLRHDNVLYGKQSYTAGTTCSYPCGYVEAIPIFYARVDTLMRRAEAFFQTAPEELRDMSFYFGEAAVTCSTLASIAAKELSRIPMSAEDDAFLENTLYWKSQMCGDHPLGWYPRLFYTPGSEMTANLVVADVHTCPTEESGAPVGWVLHVGTGPVNMAVVIADVPDAGPSAYIGPVLSYYERVTSQFKRLTDEEWATEYGDVSSIRPPWVNAYLADINGGLRPAGEMLITGVSAPMRYGILPADIILAQNFPNPFNPSTQIQFGLPEDARVSLGIYDNLGRKVIELVNDALQAGFHRVTWNGTSGAGSPVATGIYFARFVVTSRQGELLYRKTNRMLLLR